MTIDQLVDSYIETLIQREIEIEKELYRKPIIKVNASLLATELVSVQPLSLPTAEIFYIDYRYENN